MHRIKRQPHTIALGKTQPRKLGRSNIAALMGLRDRYGAASSYAIMKTQPHQIERSDRMNVPSGEREIPPAKKINAGRTKAVSKSTIEVN